MDALRDEVDALLEWGNRAKTGNEDDQKRAIRQQACEAAMRRLLKSADGRELVRHILDESGFFKAMYIGDAQYAAFLEGRRSIGAQVLRLAQAVGLAGEILKSEKMYE